MVCSLRRHLLPSLLSCLALSGCYTVSLGEWAFERSTPQVVAAKAWQLPTPDGEFAVYLDYANQPDEWVLWLPDEQGGVGTFGDVWRHQPGAFELPPGSRPVNTDVTSKVPSGRGYWDPASYTLEVSPDGLYTRQGSLFAQRLIWYPLALPWAFALDVVTSPVQAPLWILVALDGWPREWPLGSWR